MIKIAVITIIIGCFISLSAIEEYYLNQCSPVYEGQEWTDLDTKLIKIDNEMIDVYNNLQTKQESIDTMIEELKKNMSLMDEKIRGANLKDNYTEIQKFLDDIRDRLENVNDKINEAKRYIEQSKNSVGNIYCKIQKQIDYHRNKSNNNNLPNVARRRYGSAASNLDKKISTVKNMIGYFEDYWAKLEKTLKNANDNREIMISIQADLSTYRNANCQNPDEECIYKLSYSLKYSLIKTEKLRKSLIESNKRFINAFQEVTVQE